MPRFRTHKIKHEHSIIDGLWPLLERIAACPAVHGITPGRIRPASGNHGLVLTFQYETDTGLKLLAKGPDAVQEVFLVTADRGAVRRWLADQGLVAGAAPPPAPPRQPAGRQVRLPFAAPCTACGRPIQAGSRAVAVGGPAARSARGPGLPYATGAPGERYYHIRCCPGEG